MRPPAPLPALPAADLAELGRLWHRHRPRLLAALGRRVAPRLATRAGPDELLAAAYVRAVRRWPRFRARPGRSAYGWFYRLALDEVIEAWRRETRGRHDCRRDVPWPDGSSALDGLGLVAAGTTPSQALIREEVREKVRRVLGRLPPRDRRVLAMRYEAGLDPAAIGRVLGATRGHVYVLVKRAHDRFRRLWEAADGPADGA